MFLLFYTTWDITLNRSPRLTIHLGFPPRVTPRRNHGGCRGWNDIWLGPFMGCSILVGVSRLIGQSIDFETLYEYCWYPGEWSLPLNTTSSAGMNHMNLQSLDPRPLFNVDDPLKKVWQSIHAFSQRNWRENSGKQTKWRIFHCHVEWQERIFSKKIGTLFLRGIFFPFPGDFFSAKFSQTGVPGKQGSKQARKQRREPASKQASKQASQPASKQARGPASKANKQARKQASKPASKQASEPASQQASKPASQQTSQPASQQASKPASKQASQPASKQASKPASKQASKGASKGASEQASKPASKQASQAASQATSNWSTVPLYH